MRKHDPDLTAERETVILDAAQHHFTAMGIQKVTMADIAADAGLSKAALYYYFPSKEVLFQRVVEREQRRFLLDLERIAAKKQKAAQRIVLCQKRRHALFITLFRLDAANLQSWFALHPVAREQFEALFQAELETLTGLIREGRNTGEFKVASPSRTAGLLLRTLLALRLSAIKSARGLAVPPVMSRQLERDERDLVAMFLRGMQPDSE